MKYPSGGITTKQLQITNSLSMTQPQSIKRFLKLHLARGAQALDLDYAETDHGKIIARRLGTTSPRLTLVCDEIAISKGIPESIKFTYKELSNVLAKGNNIVESILDLPRMANFSIKTMPRQSPLPQSFVFEFLNLKDKGVGVIYDEADDGTDKIPDGFKLCVFDGHSRVFHPISRELVAKAMAANEFIVGYALAVMPTALSSFVDVDAQLAAAFEADQINEILSPAPATVRSRFGL